MKRVLKWIGIALGSLVAIALVAVAALYALSGRKLSAKHELPPERELVIVSDSATVSLGAKLVSSIPCGECHDTDLGGKVIADAGPFGLLAAPNLTRGRGGREPPLSDIEWERAVRHGVRRDGTSFLIMPSEVFTHIADTEMAAMIAYLKQIPPVDREVPPLKLRIIGRMLLGAGQIPLATDTTPKIPHVAAVDTTPTAEYGRYLVAVSACEACHGASLSGGPGFGPDEPPVSNITPGGIGTWTEADFIRAMRDGTRPGGTKLSETMPWKFFANRSDGELRAMWLHLQRVPSKQFREP